MSLPDEQWNAELHRRLSTMYAEKNQLQKAHADLCEQTKHMKTRLTALEQEKENYEYSLANARQTAVLELRPQMERLVGQKTEELNRLQTMYGNMSSERDRQKADIERLTKEQERLCTENQTWLQQCHSTRTEMESLTQILGQKDATIKTQNADLSRLQNDYKELEMQAEGYTAQVEQLTAAQKTHEQSTLERLQQVEQEKDSITASVQELITQSKQQKHDLAQRQSALIAESSKVSHLEAKEKKLFAQLEKAKAQLQHTASELEHLRADKDTVNALFDTYFEKSNEQEQLLAHQKTELEGALVKNDSLETKVVALTSQVASLQAQLDRSHKPPVVRVDKAVQANPRTVDVAVQTRAVRSAPVPQRATTSAAVQTSVQTCSTQLTTQQAGRRTRQNAPTTRRTVGLVAADADIPLARLFFLGCFPALNLPSSARTEPAIFTRTYLSACLGGGMQGVVGTFDVKKERKPLAAQFDLLGCLYPQRHLNPWLPPEPGAHGYLFLGLVGPGKDHEKFLTPVTRALFIYEESGWKYYGQYTVERNPERDLTVEEWNELSDEFKDGDNGYCAMTLNKSMGGSRYQSLKNDNKSRHDEQVRAMRAMYDAGELRVPCISLQCIAYSEGLVEGLKRQSPTSQTSRKRKRATQDNTEDASDTPNTDVSRPATRSQVTGTHIDLA